MTPGLGVVAALVALGVLLWPRGRVVPVQVPGGASGSGSGEERQDPEIRSVRARLRRLWSAEVRLGGTAPGWVAEFAELSAVGLDAGLPLVEAARLACAVGAGDGGATGWGDGWGGADGGGAGAQDPGRGGASTGRRRLGASTGRRRLGTGGSASRMHEVGTLISSTQDRGGRLGEALREAARDDRDLAFLAAAWRLSEDLGTASAPAARLSAEVLRERCASAERQAVLAAGPRASMWLLTLLPLTGPLVAVLLGLPVSSVYGTGAAVSAAVAGLGLTGLGWAWSRFLLRRSLRPAVVR